MMGGTLHGVSELILLNQFSCNTFLFIGANNIHSPLCLNHHDSDHLESSAAMYKYLRVLPEWFNYTSIPNSPGVSSC